MIHLIVPEYREKYPVELKQTRVVFLIMNTQTIMDNLINSVSIRDNYPINILIKRPNYRDSR